VCTAYRAELPRYGVSLIGPRVGLRRSFRVGETLCSHEHEQIRRSARDMLTGAAVALRSQNWLALRNIAHSTAIAPSFEPHDTVAHERLAINDFAYQVANDPSMSA
jgi:hypothetical protein